MIAFAWLVLFSFSLLSLLPCLLNYFYPNQQVFLVLFFLPSSPVPLGKAGGVSRQPCGALQPARVAASHNNPCSPSTRSFQRTGSVRGDSRWSIKLPQWGKGINRNGLSHSPVVSMFLSSSHPRYFQPGNENKSPRATKHLRFPTRGLRRKSCCL